MNTIKYLLVLGLLAASNSSASSANERYDVIFRGGNVYDGSGTPWIRSDIAVSGDRIAAMGDLAGAEAERVVEARGLYLAPGFVDTHSHASRGLADEGLSPAHALLAQGVTSVFVNPDGSGAVDLEAQQESFLEHGLGVNVAQFVPHGSVRRQVMGTEDREASDDELDEMRALVEKGMEAGAFGLSSGLFYVPGSYSPTGEVIELARVASRYGGAYQSHIRDEADYTVGVVASVDEVIEIAREAELPGIVTHIKVLGPRVWGYSAALVHRIERAREDGVEIFADQYPYTASATSLSAALMPHWAREGGRSGMLERMEDPDDRERIRRDILDNLDRRGGADRIQIRSFSRDSSLEGLLLSEISQQRGIEPADAVLDLLEEGSPGIVSYNMHDGDVARLMRQPWTMTASDGGLSELGRGVPHPRQYGTFPRKLRKYAMEDGVVDFAFAIRSMTGMPALVYRVRDRGVLREGAYADIVVFNKEKLNDPATFTDPHHLAEGMVHVLVNGEFAVDNGEFADVMSGRVLLRR